MSSRLESKELLTSQQMEVVVNDSDIAMPLILGIGLANLSSCSHGTFTFLWLLDVPDARALDELPQEPAQQLKFRRRIVLMLLLMLHWGRSLFR